ncbi:MAG: T9SS type A sorting domain-containing protein [Bacteroidetes bacterium]|nr:T9SS type A sorting domain-containing protein [Bacteroidota bacterium]
MRRPLMVCLLLAGMGSLSVSAQKLERAAVASSGGNLSNGSMQLSFTIGEAVSGVMTASSGSVTNGFQQFLKDTTSSVTFPTQMGSFKAYPNPVTDRLTVEGTSTTYIDLMDANGRVIGTFNTTSGTSVLDMTMYARGIYVLRAQDNNGSVQTIRLVKY